MPRTRQEGKSKMQTERFIAEKIKEDIIANRLATAEEIVDELNNND